MWPWVRARRDIDDARQRAANAERQALEAELMAAGAEAGHQAAQQLVERARQSTTALRRQVDRNGFTEMLQESFGKRGHA
ncbi:DUF7620 family protein [Mycolicibacterium sphagni]|uniref:Uncharacterized protein n=1 Tax=Mycolicibacterium sphagni TaxID=1786 RepID=A0A255DM35_9MYCO|nr:hypothetical protein CG716_09750 [Mycolicibacterium sphagni]